MSSPSTRFAAPAAMPEANAIHNTTPPPGGSDAARSAERYFDYAAAAPMHPAAIEAYARAARDFPGNPSSVHPGGTAARRALDEAKERLCACAGFDDGRLILTSGATEANNLILRGVLAGQPEARILIAADAHPSLWFAVADFPENCETIPLPPGGVLRAESVAGKFASAPALCSLGHACNETGLIHDVRDIAVRGGLRDIPVHIDGTQALGKLPVDLADIPCDYYTFSAHKFGGPHGLGGVFLRGAPIQPLLRGGNQEWKLRAGTENVPAALAAATALEAACAQHASEAHRLRTLTAALAERLRAAWPQLLVNSDCEHGLPGILSVSFPGVPAHDVAIALGMEDFAVSTGSACHADLVIPSRVILALGRSEQAALGTLRISMGRNTTAGAVADLGEALARVLRIYT